MPPKETTDKRRPRRNRRRGGRSRAVGVSTPADSDAAREGQSSAISTLIDDSIANDSSICSVCTEPAKDWAVGSCGHAVCSDCSHRMRVLYKREACVMCMTLLEEVVVVPSAAYDPDTPFAELRALSTAHDDQVGMHFVDAARLKELRSVRGFKCSVCDRVESSAAKLRQHAKAVHSSLYCEVCFTGGSSFVSELPVFSLHVRGGCPALREHNKKTHPMCRFCRKYYLNDDTLYAHLQADHESCSICERQGRLHEYYRSFEQLEAHYISDHFICQDRGCRGVVFASKAELKAHQVQNHMNSVPRSSRRVRVELSDLGPRIDPEQELREQQNRQNALRRHFMASQVIFSGSTNDDHRGDGGPSSLSGPRPSVEPPPPSAGHSQSQQSRPEANTIPARPRRAPDDDAYYPLPLPQNQAESNQRSTLLVQRMRSTLDPAAFESFRSSSGQFRNGVIDATAYYSATVETFGVRNAIRDFLPELIALLPDANKRQALTGVVTGRRNTGSNGVGSAAEAAANDSQEFPSLQGMRPTAPSLTPTVRGPYLRVPQSSDFPQLNRGNTSTGGSSGGPSGDQRHPPDMRRVFGGATPARVIGRTPLSLRRAFDVDTRPGPHTHSAHEAFPSLGGRMQAPVTSAVDRHAFRTVGGGSRLRSAAGGPPIGLRGGLSSSGEARRVEMFPALGTGNGDRVVDTWAERDDSEGRTLAGSSNALWRDGGLDTTPSDGDGIDADVSNRAGAVWGGTSETSWRRRGPGRRVPAVFPDGGGPSEGTRSMVVDMREAARERRIKIENSSLPKVGGSGYGFAWERKKHAKKKKEIKGSFAGSGSDSDGTRMLDMSVTQIAGSSSNHASLAAQAQASDGGGRVAGFERLSIGTEDNSVPGTGG